NADICAGDANATLKGFRVQTTWSNAEKKCVAQRNVGNPNPDFSLAATPASQTVTAGGSTSYNIVLTPANGFNSAVAYSLGGAGALAHTANLSLVVTPAALPDFSVAVSPSSATVTAGNAAQATLTVGASGGFAGAVALAASGAPAGVNVALDHASITGSGTA